jgi:hypothetical protein
MTGFWNDGRVTGDGKRRFITVPPLKAQLPGVNGRAAVPHGQVE